MANISSRDYVSIEKKHFKPTELGFLVTDLLIKGFPDIMDTAFTAQMESNLDKVEQGEETWTDVLAKFYGSFELDLEKAKNEMNGEVLTDIICPKCSSKMAIKSGRNGLFLACTGYPQCQQTTNFTRDEKGKVIVEEVPEAGKKITPCEKCGLGMVVRNGKFGPFLACSGYPECNNTRALEPSGAGSGPVPTDTECKSCGARMVIKMSRFGQRFLACEEYPKCTYTEPISTNISCPNENCSGTLVERASKKGRKFYSCNRYPECRFAMWDEPYDDACPQCGTKVLSVKRQKGTDEPVLACRKKGCNFKKDLASF